MTKNRRKVFPSKKLFIRFMINMIIFGVLSLFLVLFHFNSQNTIILVSFTCLKVIILILWAVSFFHLIQVIIERKFTLFFDRMDREINDIVYNDKDEAIIFRRGGFIDWDPKYLNNAIEELKFFHIKSEDEFQFILNTVKSSLKNKNYEEFDKIVKELLAENE